MAENLDYDANQRPSIEVTNSSNCYFPDFNTPTNWVNRYAERQIPTQPITDPLPTISVR